MGPLASGISLVRHPSVVAAGRTKHSSASTSNNDIIHSSMGNPLRELGIASGDDTVTVEHLFILTVSAPFEKPLRRVLDHWGESSKDTVKVLQVLGYAAAAYLVLTGISKLVDSIKSKSNNNNNNDEKNAKNESKDTQ